MRFTTRLLPCQRGNLGIIQLNHPKALNALAMDMIHCMQDTLDQWYTESSPIKAILIKAAENKDAKRPSFCAGGDVKAMYDSGMNHDGTHGQGRVGLDTADFFRYEYNIDHALATSTKIPQISLWNGVVMGGGAGISAMGKYRVATEHSLFAMPETALGLFPDVGSCFWMPRTLKGGLPAFVALTGHRLKPEDLIYSGLATHYVHSSQLQSLEEALVEATESDTALVDPVAPVLMSFHQEPLIDPRNSFLARHRSTIDQIFNVHDNESARMEDMMEKLEEMANSGSKENGGFASDTLKTLQKMSPTSLKVTLEGLKRGAKLPTIGDDLHMEFRMSQGFTRHKSSDFFEGVRALLVDKDKNPQWNPKTLEEVTDAMVDSCFQPIEQEWEIPITSDQRMNYKPFNSSAKL